MSESESESEQSGAGRREVAYRLFAAEFDDADFSYSESDEERAPNYVITPSGARVNRLFVVGVLTEVEQVSEDVLRARVVDPTGAFVLYAGQYQPDEQAFLDRADPPMFVAVTGKARTFQPDDSEQVFTSVRPESINEVDATTRDRWTVQTAEQTIDRVAHMATALSMAARGDDLRETLEAGGVDDGLAAGIPLAIEHYGPTGAYLSALRDLALDAARLVADELDEVDGLELDPSQGDDTALQSLATAEVEPSAPADDTAEVEPSLDDESTSAGVDSPETSGSETTAEATEQAASNDDTGPVSTTDEAVTETTETDETITTETATVETTSEGSADGTATETATVDDESGSAERGANEPTATPSETDETGSEEPEPAEPATEVSTTGDSVDAGADAAGDDIGDFEPGEFELDEDEREEIEAEFGTEFQSGTDVPDPGEADIETPDPEELAEAEPEGESADRVADAAEPVEEDRESGAEAEHADSDEREATEPERDGESQDDVDLGKATIEVMEELDDGNGADRETLVDTLVDRYGVGADDVEDAIQNALMDGRCYEPDDTSVKPI